MDILNFIAWIKGKRQVVTMDPARSLIPLGLKDGRRDDDYLAAAITVQDFVAQLAPGTVGPTGPQGPQGVQGIAGPQGNQGSTGPAGVQGSTGVQGIQGVAGAVGPAGLNWQGAWVSGTSYVADDAVSYASASWFCILATSGTTNPSSDPTHWALLASQGAIGPQGIQGAQGVQGVSGPAGIQGPIGLTGPTGVQGPLGPVGPTGAAGVQGVPGPVGPAGLTWQGAWVSGGSYILNDAVSFNGASYFCVLATTGTTDPDLDPTHWALLAAVGLQGPAGATGATGATGLTGGAGPQGIPGPVGPAGLNWASVWVSGATYAENDVVSFGGSSYFCYNPAGVTSATDPSVDTANWALLALQGATGPQGPQGNPGLGAPSFKSAGAFFTVNTSYEQLTSVYIPANTYTGEDAFALTVQFNKVPGSTATMLVYVNTVDDITGATVIAAMNMSSTLSEYTAIQRTYFIRSTNTFSYSTANAFVDDITTSNNTGSTTTIDWTIDQYIIVSGRVGNPAFALTCTGMRIY
jgi:hypothetical protein